METLPGYDAWKLGGDLSHSSGEAFCHNQACPEFNDALPVTIVTEYGRSYWEPDTCPQCGHDLHALPREEEDDDEE